MSEEQDNAIMQYFEGNIGKEYFENVFFTGHLNEKKEYLLRLLEEALDKKNGDNIENILYVCFVFELFSQQYLRPLHELLQVEWHQRHEDIVSALDEIGSPDSIDILYRTALTRYSYLDYDQAYALAVKCIWALGNIGTPQAIHKLILLTDSENNIIKENAEDQLKRLKCFNPQVKQQEN